MKITRKSPVTGRENTLDLDISYEQYRAWQLGSNIQDAMPNLTADEREFLISGVFGGEWDQLFPEEDCPCDDLQRVNEGEECQKCGALYPIDNLLTVGARCNPDCGFCGRCQ